MPKPTPEQIKAFIDDLAEVCRKHGFYVQPYYHEYDEYDADYGLEVKPLKYDGDLHMLNTMQASDNWN